MSQYRTGSVNVTNGSALVTGIGTAWLSEIQAGQQFSILRSGVSYTVAGIESDTRLLLSAPYRGADALNAPYTVTRDFTPYYNIPFPGYGDIDTAALWKEAVTRIEQAIVEQDTGLTVIESRQQAVPPATPDERVNYIVPAAAVGAWSGQGDRIAVWDRSVWKFVQPKEGWRVYVRDESYIDYVYDTIAGMTGWHPGQQVGQAVAAAQTARDEAMAWASKTDGPVSGGAHSAKWHAEDAAESATSAQSAVAGIEGRLAEAQLARDTAVAARDGAVTAQGAVQAAAVSTAAAAAAAGSAQLATEAAKDATLAAKADVLAAGTAAGAAQQASEAARDLAQAWATKTADSVDGVGWSAKHYAEQAGGYLTAVGTARTAAEAAAATATAKAGEGATSAGQAALNAATASAKAGEAAASAGSATQSAIDALAAKGDAVNARDLGNQARDLALSYRQLAQAYAENAQGQQVEPGLYSAKHWAMRSQESADQAALIVGGNNFGIIGDGTAQRLTATAPGELFHLVGGNATQLVFNAATKSVTFNTLPGSIEHQTLAGAGANTHAQVDAHLADTAGHIPAAVAGDAGKVLKTAGAGAAAWGALTWTDVAATAPTTLAGYGITDAVSSALLGAADGVATLGPDQKIRAAQLPDLVGRKRIVADEAARLALPADGDLTIAIQADTGVTWALDAGADPGVAGNWTQLGAPLAHTHPAASITVTPGGGLAATDVQAALAELDGEKANAADVYTRAQTAGVVADAIIRVPAAGVGGTGDAITLTTGRGLAARSTARKIRFVAAAGNTGAVRIDEDGLGPVDVRDPAGAALAEGTLVAGSEYEIAWDADTGCYRLSGGLGGGGAGGLTLGALLTSSGVAVTGCLTPLDSSAGSFTVTLPASPANGTMLALADVGGALTLNPVTLDLNGATLRGLTGLTLDMDHAYLPLLYRASANEWIILDTTAASLLPAQTGNAGKVLVTDGATVSWQAADGLPARAGHAGEFLTNDGTTASWAAVNAVQQSAPVYVASGGSTMIAAKSILAAYEQYAGTAFNLAYTTESDYAQGDAATGTDLVAGAFQLYNAAGAAIDGNTKLLMHGEGPHLSTECTDDRKITPFGTGCMYFDGASYWKVPSSFKVAWGASQNFTYEGWFHPTAVDASTVSYVFDARTNASGGDGVAFAYYGDGTLRMHAGALDLSSAAGACPLNSGWHHFAIVRSGGTTKLYLDGVAVGGMSGSDSYAYSNQPIVLGMRTTTPGCYLNGWLSNVRVSKVARYTGNFTRPSVEFTRDADTVFLFKGYDGHGSQLIRDDSRSGHEVQINSAGSITNARTKFGSTSLTGSVRIAASKFHQDFMMSADDFTADFWVYPTAFPASAAVLLGFFDASAPGPQIAVGAGGALTWYVSTNGSTYNLANGASLGASLAINQWNHVTLMRSGATLYAFLNGAVIGTPLTVGTSAIFSGSGTVLLNRGYGADTPNLTGQFDELRVKRGEAAFSTSGFTPPTSPYTSDDRTVLLLHFEGANGDKVTLDSSESSYGNDGSANTVIRSLDMTTALAATYTRGGNSTSLATGTGGYYAQYSAAAPVAGNSLYFSSWTPFCLEMWVYCTSVSATQYFVDLYDQPAGSDILALFGNAGGTVSASVNGSTIVTTTATLSVGWNHVALVRDGRGWAVAVNGTLSTPTSPQTNITYSGTGTCYCYFGMRYTSANYMNGAYDSIRLTHGKPRYTANFTPGNITADDDTTLCWVFNGSVGQKWVKELSKNTALISASGARTVKDGVFIQPTLTAANTVCTSTSAAKFGSTGLSFGGVANNRLSIPNSGAAMHFAGDYTIECWVKPTIGASQVIVAKRDAGTNANAAYILRVGATGQVQFTHFSGGTANTVSSTTNAGASSWTHVAVTLSGTTLRLFVNGAQEGGNVTVNGVMNGTTNGLFIGANHDGSEPYSGCLDELRISNTARWTSGFSVPTIPYGQQYTSGPQWVATKPGLSSIDLSTFSSIDGAAFTGSTPVNTTLSYLVSFDNYATPLKRWNGSAWVATAYGMTWSNPTLTTTATAAGLDGAGNSWADLLAGLQAWTPPDGASLNIVAVLNTTNQSFTPTLDNITVTMDEYQLLQPVADYSVKRRKAGGSQTLTFTRTKAGNAVHVFDFIN